MAPGETKAAMLSRAKFEPIVIDEDYPIGPLDECWTTMIASSADFPIDVYETALKQLVHHPEYNSTLILRSEVVREYADQFPHEIPMIKDTKATQCIHRKLLPRRPGRDAGLEQYCTFYASPDHEDSPTDTLVLTPIVPPGGSLPYYHPAVTHLAFRYIASHEPPLLQIDVIPLPNTPVDLNSRLYRTCLALLDTVHRYGWGAMSEYTKRVHHDVMIPRDAYQDLYLQMRERHKHLIDTWQEVTDPLKHVFEDIGIATFLMLLWKDTYRDPLVDEPWPRPPGGFVDLGCGNGLLTHILIAEGYDGVGVDLRARTSWQGYGKATAEKLQVWAFDPLSPSAFDCTYPFKRDAFIIGNHADELTPWLPVLATLTGASAYLSIPCCAWGFEKKFQRGAVEAAVFPELEERYPDAGQMVQELNLGGDTIVSVAKSGGKLNYATLSAYSAYRIWLASLSLHCGWEVECEMLRIPSTRNWGLVGRRRIVERATQDAENPALARVRSIVDDVLQRAVFRPRKPEGKAGH